MGWDSANFLPRNKTRLSSVGHWTPAILSKRVKKKKDDSYRSRGKLYISSFLYVFFIYKGEFEANANSCSTYMFQLKRGWNQININREDHCVTGFFLAISLIIWHTVDYFQGACFTAPNKPQWKILRMTQFYSHTIQDSATSVRGLHSRLTMWPFMLFFFLSFDCQKVLLKPPVDTIERWIHRRWLTDQVIDQDPPSVVFTTSDIQVQKDEHFINDITQITVSCFCSSGGALEMAIRH